MNIWEQKNFFQLNKLVQRLSFHSIYEALVAYEMRKGVVQLYIKNNDVTFSLAWKIVFSDNFKVLVLTFSGMGNTVFSWAKKLTEVWYLLITEKFLF